MSADEKYSLEIEISPRRRSELLVLFKKTGNAILDKILGVENQNERSVRTEEEFPADGYWPQLRHTQQYVEQGDITAYVWSGYEIENPRDGDTIGAGINLGFGTEDGQFIIYGLEGGKKLKRVNLEGAGISKDLFDKLVAIFMDIERQT